MRRFGPKRINDTENGINFSSHVYIQYRLKKKHQNSSTICRSLSRRFERSFAGNVRCRDVTAQLSSSSPAISSNLPMLLLPVPYRYASACQEARHGFPGSHDDGEDFRV